MPSINVATVTADPVARGAATDELDAEYFAETQEFVRSQIDPVPGSGPMRGVWLYNGLTYAFRDDELGQFCRMYVGTLTGWQLVDLGSEVEFESGSGEIFVGDLIVGGSSGATAVVTKVATKDGSWFGNVNAKLGTDRVYIGNTLVGSISGASAVITGITTFGGDWANGDWAGILQYEVTTLPFVVDDILSVGGVDKAVASGASYGNDAEGVLHYTTHLGAFTVGEDIKIGANIRAVALLASAENYFPPGGRFEFINYNFYGSTYTLEMYGVNGVSRGFIWDGTDFFFVHTGMVVDTPAHLIAFKYHLFYSFEGGSVQHSAPGRPEVWDAIVGAAEIAIGQEVVGFVGVPGEALAIFGRNKTLILKGTGVFDWQLNTHDEEAGAVEWSLQRFKIPTYLDDRGVTNLNAVDSFGDFQSGTLSQNFQTVIDSALPLIVASLRVRTKNQYRLFLSDGRMLFMSLDGKKLMGMTLVTYPAKIIVTASVERLDGQEVLLGGCRDGYLYIIDSGTNFDGLEIDAYIRPVFNHLGSPEYDKRYFKAVLEIDSPKPIDLTYLPVFGYGDPYLPSPREQNVPVSGGGGVWDGTDTFWRDFYWDSQIVASAEGYIDGVGKNLSLYIRSVGTYDPPHTIQGIIIHYSKRGVDR